MMSRRNIALSATGLLLVLGVTFGVMHWAAAPKAWPDFLMDKPDAPRYNTEVAKRDFGYRTGNHVPVGLYFKLLPGMELLSDQMVVNGDFQIVSQQEYREKSGEDTLVRIDLTVQTFVLKPKLEVKPTIAYRSAAGGEVKKLDLLPIEVYSSQTFDGRKSEHPKENEDVTFVADSHLITTGGMVTVGGLGVLFAVGVLMRNRRPRVKREKVAKKSKAPDAATGPFPPGWTPVQEAWAAIVGGDRSKPAFTLAAETIRTYFGVNTLTVSELQCSTAQHKDLLAAFLTICEKALWTTTALSDADVEAASTVLRNIEAALLAPPAPATPAAK
jgi:hypothetical protein